MTKYFQYGYVLVLPTLLLYVLKIKFWPLLVVLIPCLWLLPKRRELVLFIFGVGAFFIYGEHPLKDRIIRGTLPPYTDIVNTHSLVGSAVALALTFLFLALLRHKTTVGLLRRGFILTSAAGILLLTFCASFLGARTETYLIIFSYIGLLWPTLCAHVTLNLANGSARSAGFLTDFIYIKPFWKFNFLAPMPLFIGAITQGLSHNPERFMEVQRRGVRLLVWALALKIISTLFDACLMGDRSIFHFQLFSAWQLISLKQLLMEMSLGQYPSMPSAWIIVMLDLVRKLLTYAVLGHTIIGVARICGFDLLRNTYAPHRAKSFLDFFSRYNFYFKEYLLHLYFYPVFLRLNGLWLPLRLGLSLLNVAAGNFLTLFIAFSLPTILLSGFANALFAFSNYFIFCIALSIGLFVSFLPQLTGTPRGIPRCFRPFVTLSYFVFFAVIRVFDTPDSNGFVREGIQLVKILFGG